MTEEVAIIADSKGEGYSFAKGVYEFIKGKEGRDFPIKMIDMERIDFKDGEFKLRVADNIRRSQCYLIHDSNKKPCEWYSELNFALDAMAFSSPSEINVVLPYTKFARQDRKETSRVSVNAKALANMVSRYADRGMTVDLHNPAMQAFFDIPFDNLYSFPSLINYLKKDYGGVLEKLVVVSPDVGGGKRVRGFAKRLKAAGIDADVAIGDKVRVQDNDVEKVEIMGSVRGKNCLIIDDIIDTGNTLIKTGEAVRSLGAKSVYAYGTHGLFSDGADKFSIFDKVFVSDTLKNANRKNIEVVSLVPLFGEAIYRTIRGESLSVLFDGN